MFKFKSTDKIGFRDIDDDYSLIFISALIQQHLYRLFQLKSKHKGKFDVCYNGGGAGFGFLDLYSLDNPKASLCFGISGENLSYNVVLDSETVELANDEGGTLKKEVVSLEELDKWLSDIIDEWFVNDKVSKYPQFVTSDGEKL